MKREVDLGSHSLPHWFKQELTPLHKTNVQGKLHELTDNPVADTPSQSSPVPDKPCGFCGRKHHERMDNISAQELCESRGGRPGLPVPNSFYALCGRKATLNLSLSMKSTTVEHSYQLPPHPNEPLTAQL